MSTTLNDHILKQCNRTIAFVFAPNVQSAPRIFETGSFLRGAQMAAIFLMADASVAEEAIEAMRKLERKGRGPLVQAAEFDFSLVYGVDTAHPQFRLEELPNDLLHVMRALSESVLDVYEYVLVVDASQGVPSDQALEALYKDTDASNHEFAPYLLWRSYLEML